MAKPRKNSAKKAQRQKADAAKQAKQGTIKARKQRVTVTLSKAQQAARQKHLDVDALKIEGILYKAKGKAVHAWLRGDDVRPMLRQDWYWIYSDDRAPEAVERFLYSRGFRRHSTKPAYIHDGGKGVCGYGDETRYEASSAFGVC